MRRGNKGVVYKRKDNERPRGAIQINQLTVAAGWHMTLKPNIIGPYQRYMRTCISSHALKKLNNVIFFQDYLDLCACAWSWHKHVYPPQALH